MADPLRTLLGGFIEKIPADAPSTLRTGFLFWRATVIILPLLCIAGGIAVQTTGQELVAIGESLMGDLFLLFITLGFAYIIGALFLALGSVFVLLGGLLVLLAPVVFFLLTWSLGRVLRGERHGIGTAAWSMGISIVLGLFFGTVPGAVLAEVLDAPALALPFTFVAVAAPVLGLVFVLQRDSRRWLRRHADGAPAA